MKFKKHNWKKVRLANVCDKANTVDYRKQSGTFNYVDIGSINSELYRINKVQEIDWKNASSRARQVIKKNDTLFSTVRVNLKRVALVDKEIENGIASTGFTILRANESFINPLYLFYNSISPNFLDNLINLQVGTAYPAVTDKMVFNQKIPLPSLPEQKQIAELFQSIETVIEQMEQQETNLSLLQKRLVDGLLKKEPEFGNLLNSKNTTISNFHEIAECDKKYPDHSKEVERFVGLENIEPENFQLQGFGLVANGTTFTKRFSKGDILFGKRRAYLKKVAVAGFDGICSNDILVIRAKANKMLQRLLPFYISSNTFIQHAISTSAGSLSPRTKWKDLATLAVSIPDLKTQQKILEVFEQLQQTSEEIKAQKQILKNLKQKLLNEILG